MRHTTKGLQIAPRRRADFTENYGHSLGRLTAPRGLGKKPVGNPGHANERVLTMLDGISIGRPRRRRQVRAGTVI